MAGSGQAEPPLMTGAAGELGQAIYGMAEELFPICRSITGDGVRETLRLLQDRVGLQIHEVKSGAKVFDWTVPNEWNIRDAYVARTSGDKVIDFKASNLHVVSYSTPIKKRLAREDLLPHLHTLPQQPDYIPYRTSYYSPSWGFCARDPVVAELTDDEYDVVIDSDLEPGSLTYGELFLPGKTSAEILLSTHICHPSLANDNCSGMAVLTFLAAELAKTTRRYSYRLLFVPGTIGAITWLAINEHKTPNIKHGLVVAGVGNAGGPTYKKSRQGDAPIDRAMRHVFKYSAGKPTILDYFPYGYDERQYCSPGFNLPVGLLQNSVYGSYDEYHTSGDNMGFISAFHLENSYRLILSTIGILEEDGFFLNTNPKCEPQLGKRGLYALLGGDKAAAAAQMTMLWTLAYSDGDHSLLDIARIARVPFQDVKHISDLLRQHGLLLPTKQDV